MTKPYFFLLVFLTTPSFAAKLSPEKKGLQIAEQSAKSDEGYMGEKNKMEMILINAHGDQVKREMTSTIKEVSGDGDKSIITFLWPADVKGTKMLTWSHKNEDDDQWLYLPAIKRVKRISSRSKTGSFMGSEFSYEDLSSQEVEKYKYKYIKEEKFDNQTAWVIERYPVDKNSGYKKQVVWMSKSTLHPIKIEYYDRKGELLKTGLFTDFKKYKKWWRWNRIEMTNHQTKKKSIMTWKSREMGVDLSDRLFRKDSLKK